MAYPPAAEAFRAEVRDFLAAALPADWPGIGALDRPEAEQFALEWRRTLFDHGFLGIAWPKEYGGGGRTKVEQVVLAEELARARVPLGRVTDTTSVKMMGNTLVRWGTEDQKRRFLPRILSGDDVWVQGYSEPEAGSDLASLRTSAVERDDHFVLSGQKTWVSWGQFARWCGVLARTDETVPTHRGISMLIVDMRSPGVELRPMTQITGHAEFCELFLDDVVVPKENLLSERGDGWKIAMHTLGHERGTAALPRQVKLRTWLDRAVRVAAERTLDGEPLIDDPEVQVALARALIGIEVLRHHAYRTVGEFLNGGAVGPDSSSVKLLMAEAEQRLAATALEVLGATMQHAEPAASAGNELWYETYLYSRAATVYGGTQQIQRNIIADRVLGLPKE
jgi:alkylation response protein AidB-like acyl-CoA dehydrogenase